jgi:hypothetical protein
LKNQIFTIILLLSLISGTVILTNSYVFAEEQKIPSWVRNVVKWWGEGQVSDDEFIKGMKFLVENKIMNIDLPASSTGIAETINGQPLVQTDKTTYNTGDEIKISGSGFEKGDVVIVVGNLYYLSLVDNYSKSLDWGQTDFSELSVLMQYQYSDNGNGEWQKRPYPSGFAVSTKVQADATGTWQITLKNFKTYEKDSTGNSVEKQYPLPADQYIVKVAQKIYNKDDSSGTGYRTLSIKTAYSYITVQ